MYSMGNNSHGKLGLGQDSNRLKLCSVPTLVEGIHDIVKVVCGMSHTLALARDGSVYSWGQAKYGALGLGELENDVLLPRVISSISGVVDIEAGCRHSIFKTSDKVFSCGDAMHGQLALDTNEFKVTEPREITELTGWQVDKIACGQDHTLFLSKGRVFGVGCNTFGQVGNGSTMNQRILTEI